MMYSALAETMRTKSVWSRLLMKLDYVTSEQPLLGILAAVDPSYVRNEKFNLGSRDPYI